jgi:hypothetical protein
MFLLPTTIDIDPQASIHTTARIHLHNPAGVYASSVYLRYAHLILSTALSIGLIEIAV